MLGSWVRAPRGPHKPGDHSIAGFIVFGVCGVRSFRGARGAFPFFSLFFSIVYHQLCFVSLVEVIGYCPINLSFRRSVDEKIKTVDCLKDICHTDVQGLKWLDSYGAL